MEIVCAFGIVFTFVVCEWSAMHDVYMTCAKKCAVAMGANVVKFALVTRWPYCPGRQKKLCFTTPSLTPMVSIARLGVVKQSFFGLPTLPGQYGRRVTRANKAFCFFSMRERAEFLESCNLIGSGSGRNFYVLPANPGRQLGLLA